MKETIRLLFLLWVFKSSFCEDPLVQFTEGIAGVSRVANGLALSDAIGDKQITEQNLINELLDLHPSVTVKMIEEAAEASRSLKSIMSAVQPCGTRCGDLTEIEKGFEVLDGIVNSDIKDIPDILSSPPLNDLLKFTESMDTFIVADKDLEKLVELLNDIQNLNIKGRTKIETTFQAIADSKGAHESLVTLGPNLKQPAILDQYGKILSLETLITGLPTNKSTVDALSSALPEVLRKYATANASLSSDIIQGIESKLKFFSIPKIQASEKTMSAAFKGPEDLNKTVSTDLTAVVVKNLLSQGEPLDHFVDRLKPLSKLAGKVKPIHEQLKNVQRGIDTSSIITELNSVSSELRKFGNLEKVKTCIKAMELDKTIPFGLWKDGNSKLTVFDTKMDAFTMKNTNKNIFAGLVAFFEFKTLVDVGESNIDNIKAYNNVSGVIAEIKQFKSDIGEFMVADSLKVLIDSLTFSTAFKSTKKWVDESSLISAVTCLLTDDLLKNAKAVLNASIPQFSHSTTVTGDADFLEESANLLKKLETSNKTKRSIEKRATEKGLDLKTTQKFAYGVDVFRKLSDAYEKRAVIRNLSGNETTIDSEVTSHQKVQSRKEEVWSNAHKIALKALPGDLENLNSKISKAQPESFDEVRNQFQDALTITYPELDTKLMQTLFASFQKPAGIQDTLLALATLDLNFTNAKTHVQDSQGVVKNLEEFFKEMGKANDGTTKNSSTIRPGVSTGRAINYIIMVLFGCIGTIVLISTIGHIISTIRWWKKRKLRMARRKNRKNRKGGKRKRKSGTGGGKKGGGGKKKKTGQTEVEKDTDDKGKKKKGTSGESTPNESKTKLPKTPKTSKTPTKPEKPTKKAVAGEKVRSIANVARDTLSLCVSTVSTAFHGLAKDAPAPNLISAPPVNIQKIREKVENVAPKKGKIASKKVPMQKITKYSRLSSQQLDEFLRKIPVAEIITHMLISSAPGATRESYLAGQRHFAKDLGMSIDDVITLIERNEGGGRNRGLARAR